MLQISMSFANVDVIEQWLESHVDATIDELYITYYNSIRKCTIHVWCPKTQHVYYLDTYGELNEFETIKTLYRWYRGSVNNVDRQTT